MDEKKDEPQAPPSYPQNLKEAAEHDPLLKEILDRLEALENKTKHY